MSLSLSLRLGLQAHLVFLVSIALLRVRILFSSRGANILAWSMVPVGAFVYRYRKLMNILR
ncbi:hypothetical protein CUC44_05405 [Aeromonas lusitana]|uniref:Uncharacterized protein n=1 Tax=Aeromonas lusitana TaxID=931529 RepID=A0A2M8HC53_9GAMM|nr:hypothetical protein CUC44_05405 [Aeromonas lusitana]